MFILSKLRVFLRPGVLNLFGSTEPYAASCPVLPPLPQCSSPPLQLAWPAVCELHLAPWAVPVVQGLAQGVCCIWHPSRLVLCTDSRMAQFGPISKSVCRVRLAWVPHAAHTLDWPSCATNSVHSTRFSQCVRPAVHTTCIMWGQIIQLLGLDLAGRAYVWHHCHRQF